MIAKKVGNKVQYSESDLLDLISDLKSNKEINIRTIRDLNLSLISLTANTEGCDDEEGGFVDPVNLSNMRYLQQFYGSMLIKVSFGCYSMLLVNKDQCSTGNIGVLKKLKKEIQDAIKTMFGMFDEKTTLDLSNDNVVKRLTQHEKKPICSL